MDFAGLISMGLNFFHTHKLVAIIIVVVLCILLYLKPKATFKMLAMLLVAAVILYILSLIGGLTFTGISQKREIIDNTPKF